MDESASSTSQGQMSQQQPNVSTTDQDQAARPGRGPTMPDETPGRLSDRSARPISAIFSCFVAGPQKATCQVPAGKDGVTRLAEFRLTGLSANTTSVTVDERFTLLEENPIGTVRTL